MFYDGQLDYFDFTRVGGLLTHLEKNAPLPSDQLQQVDQISLEAELVDDLIFLYHLGMSSRFKSAAGQLNNQANAAAQVQEANNRIKLAETKVMKLGNCLTC